MVTTHIHIHAGQRTLDRRAVRDKLEIELRGRRYPLSSESDAAIDAAIRQAGLWKKGSVYPDFTIYKNGEEISGGGGHNSGTMDARLLKKMSDT